MDIHIGKIILQHLEANKISSPAFARMIHIHPNGISRIFHQQYLHSKMLLKISQQLNHDFFQYYVTAPQQANKKNEELQQAIIKKNEELQQAKIKHEEFEKNFQQQQNEMEKLKIENTYLKEMCQILKERKK